MGRRLHLTCQHRLSLRRGQHRALEHILEAQRLLYNAALQERIEAWRKAGKSVRLYDQYGSLTTIRADDRQGYGALPVALSRWTLKKVDLAFQAFFDRCRRRNGKAGFPRFRGRAGWRSFGFSEFSGVRLKGGRLKFAGLSLQVRLHRALPQGASIRSCVLSRDDKGWKLALQIALPEQATVHRRAGFAVGVDWGVATLATTFDGEAMEEIANPRFGAAQAAALARAQRKLARRKKRSRQYEKARRHLRALQHRLAARRRAHLHQVSARLVRDYGMIAVEDLSLRGLTASARGTAERAGGNVRQKAGLNREILDTSPGMLIAMLRYKALRAGAQFAVIDARGTSVECSGCGAQVPKDLGERRHVCPRCDLVMGRDANAARNIRRRAVAGPWRGFGVTNGKAASRRAGIARAA